MILHNYNKIKSKSFKLILCSLSFQFIQFSSAKFIDLESDWVLCKGIDSNGGDVIHLDDDEPVYKATEQEFNLVNNRTEALIKSLVDHAIKSHQKVAGYLQSWKRYIIEMERKELIAHLASYEQKYTCDHNPKFEKTLNDITKRKDAQTIISEFVQPHLDKHLSQSTTILLSQKDEEIESQDFYGLPIAEIISDKLFALRELMLTPGPKKPYNISEKLPAAGVGTEEEIIVFERIRNIISHCVYLTAGHNGYEYTNEAWVNLMNYSPPKQVINYIKRKDKEVNDPKARKDFIKALDTLTKDKDSSYIYKQYIFQPYQNVISGVKDIKQDKRQKSSFLKKNAKKVVNKAKSIFSRFF